MHGVVSALEYLIIFLVSVSLSIVNKLKRHYLMILQISSDVIT